MIAQWILDTLDFFPFDIQSGPAFLAMYLFACAIGLLAAALAAQRLAFARTARTGAVTPQRRSGYRAGPEDETREWGIGTTPQPGDVWAIAYLRGEASAVRDVLVSTAWSEEGVAIDRTAQTVTVARAGHPDPLLNELYRALSARHHPTPVNLRLDALQVAEAAAPRLRDALTRAGLLLTPSVERATRRVVLAAGGALFAVGALRAIRGLAAGRPIGFLLLEMIALGIATAGLASGLPTNRRRQDYLAWLNAVFGPRVEAAQKLEPNELALFVAMSGTSATIIGSMLEPPVTASAARTGSDSSSSSSSTSTSSCASSSSTSSFSSSSSSSCGSSSSSGGSSFGCGG